jgi:hypothetical protein
MLHLRKYSQLLKCSSYSEILEENLVFDSLQGKNLAYWEDSCISKLDFHLMLAFFQKQLCRYHILEKTG